VLRPRFFTDHPLGAGAEITLEKDPSRHIAKALRMRTGDTLCLFNGSGSEARAVIRGIGRDEVTVFVHDVRDDCRESPLGITLAIALSRGDRMDTIVQKATELGVQRFQPLISERTGVRLDASRLEKKRDHWQKIAISACEQSGRNTIPDVAATAAFGEVIADARDEEALKLVLHPDIATASLPEACADLWLLIGPEGGFSEAEVEAAVSAGFQGLVLGPRILRTETAPLAAITFAQVRWGDF
jgi:16S rRNA (uracil1498-N3)-methyltransferase